MLEDALLGGICDKSKLAGTAPLDFWGCIAAVAAGAAVELLWYCCEMVCRQF